MLLYDNPIHSVCCSCAQTELISLPGHCLTRSRSFLPPSAAAAAVCRRSRGMIRSRFVHVTGGTVSPRPRKIKNSPRP